MRQDGVFNDEAEHAAERRKTQEQRVSGQPWMYATAGVQLLGMTSTVAPLITRSGRTSSGR